MPRTIRFFPPLLTAFCLGALMHRPALAEVDALVLEAKLLSEKGDAASAFKLMDSNEVARAGDADFDLMLGVVANQVGDHNRAILALERVLVVQPTSARARAELAKALYAVGDTGSARRLLQEAKEQGVPVEVASTLDQFMQAIDRVEEAGRSSVKAYVEVGLGHDNNVNGGPSSNVVAVPFFGGALLTLSPAGTKTAASFASFGAGLSGRQVLNSRWSAIGSVNGNFRWNGDSARAFNSIRSDLSAGAAYRDERHEFSVAAQFGTYDIGGSNARNALGLVGEWVYRFDGFRQTGMYLQTGKLTYPGQNLRDAQRDVVGGSYAHLFKDGLMAYGGIYAGQEKEFAAGNPHLGHRFHGLRAGVQKPFNPSLSAFGTLNVEYRGFGGADPFFLVTRSDQQTNINLGLTWIPAKAWRVTPQLAWTQSKSNVPINEFEQQQFSVTARRDF